MFILSPKQTKWLNFKKLKSMIIHYVSESQWLEFCRAGPSDGQGAAIDNVEFGNFKECVDYLTLKY
jgi:hypothetical protein